MTARVDIWHVRTDAVHDTRTLEVCAGLMAASEKTRHSRFVFERNRHEYLVTRGLARGVLATYVDRPPRELSFVLTEHGRPLLEDSADVRFNLTNTVELVACAVSRGREVGVDAEPLARADDILEIATTVFTDGERQGLATLSLPARRRRAVELWTLKEAYMKARGLGMSLPVEKIELVFPSEAEGGPTLRFFPPVDDVPSRWTLSTLEIDGHLISTCVEVVEGGRVEVTLKRADLSALVLSKLPVA
jgi:4'-phosphopantetheinyl transferase